jgi:DNA invertase Pin-like site-specific DNA recombinase
VRRYLATHGGKLLAEYEEVESGKRKDRPQLESALKAARKRGATVLVAKVDRLTRSQSFLSKLTEANAKVAFCDLPKIEGAQGRFLLQQMASVAELEAGMIQDRTRAALAAAKARNVRLGGHRQKFIYDAGGEIIDKVDVPPPTDAIRAMALEVRREAAREYNADIIEEIASIRGDLGPNASLRAIARELTARGIQTPAERHRAKAGRQGEQTNTWQPIQVQRVEASAPLPTTK